MRCSVPDGLLRDNVSNIAPSLASVAWTKLPSCTPWASLEDIGAAISCFGGFRDCCCERGGKNFLLLHCTATFCKVQIAMLMAGAASFADVLLLQHFTFCSCAKILLYSQIRTVKIIQNEGLF